jgi:hypothetical protein
MFDAQNHDLTPCTQWRGDLVAGDIVSFRFPIAEQGADARPKARPCLVVRIDNVAGQRYALLAYGTTSRRRSNTGLEVQVRKPAEYLVAGLNGPTKFVGARRVHVSLADCGFALSGTLATPVLGRLQGRTLRRLCAVSDIIASEPETTRNAPRVEGRHQLPAKRSAVRGVDFAVDMKPSAQRSSPSPIRAVRRAEHCC